MKSKAKKSTHSKKTTVVVILILVLALVAVGSVFAYQKFAHHSSDPTNDTDSASKSSPSQTVSTPVTQSVDKTDDTSTQSTTTSSGSTTTDNTNVIIVDASQSQNGSTFEVRAYANVLEDGTCTYTFTQGSSSLSRTSTAVTGPSTTSCTTIDIPVSDFSEKGQWNLVVGYRSSSNSYSGKASQTITIE